MQEAASNPSLDELHAEDAAHDSVKDEEAHDSMEDAKKVSLLLCVNAPVTLLAVCSHPFLCY